MENTIDRKAYRRTAYKDDYERVKRVEPKKRSSSLFLNTIINSMLLLLFVLLLKLFNFEEEFNFVKEKFSSGYSYEFIKETIQNKIKSITKKEEMNSTFYENISEEGILIEDVNSGEKKFIEAVEGVNQLMDDSIKIKEDYELKSPLDGTITSKFGCRVSDNPIVSAYHNGLDIAASKGTNIVAAHNGTVIQAEENGTYGKCIIIESGDLVTLYAHCNEILVKEGENVKIGQNIAKVGMTGNATGPHLHFEVKYKGRVVNPEDVI